MRFAMCLAVVVLAGVTIAGCNDTASGPKASPATPSPSADTSLCAQLSVTYAERASLADAFRAAIADDVTSARTQAAGLRERMRALANSLPPASSLAHDDAELRDAIEAAARAMSATADVLDPPTRGFDRLRVLQDGPIVLTVIDLVMMAGAEPGSPTMVSCPEVRYIAGEVSFPPAPNNATFGLPDRVGAWALTPKVVDLIPDFESAFRSLGVEPSTVRSIRVDMFDGTAWDAFEVFDNVSVAAERVAAALPDEMTARASAKKTSTYVAGFEVVRYEDPGDEMIALTVATRHERAIFFYSMPLDLVTAILSAIS